MAFLAVSCGGTGGHVFPGVATAKTLQQRGHDVCLLLAGRSIESATQFAWQGETLNTGAAEFSLRPSRLIPGLSNFCRSYGFCRRAFRARRPAALLSMGSYSSAGPVTAAATLRIPVILHEANVIPGRATTLFAPLATTIAVSFPETVEYLRASRTCLTGLPLRREIEQAAISPSEASACGTLLVMGGSQGAQWLNRMIPEAVAAIFPRGYLRRVIHLSGQRDRDHVERAYSSAGIPAEVHAFCRDMGHAYRRSSFAISRAGANSCMELAAFGVPALLVPYPHSARNHQLANAKAMAASGAADVLEQSQLGVGPLVDFLTRRLSSPDDLQRMRECALHRALTGADTKLADLVEQVAVPR